MSRIDFTEELGMASTIVLRGPADEASATSLMSAAFLDLATKNGV